MSGPSLSPHVGKSMTIHGVESIIQDSSFQLQDFSVWRRWDLVSRFQSLVSFLSPWAVFLIPQVKFPGCCSLRLDNSNTLYKITKIVRALWLAERRVCMRVCKHGCDVKMFCFSRTNHASTNLKKVLSWKTRVIEREFSTVMQTLDFLSGLHDLSRILPTPLVFISGYAHTENVFYCLSNPWNSWLKTLLTVKSG